MNRVNEYQNDAVIDISMVKILFMICGLIAESERKVTNQYLTQSTSQIFKVMSKRCLQRLLLSLKYSYLTDRLNNQCTVLFSPCSAMTVKRVHCCCRINYNQIRHSITIYSSLFKGLRNYIENEITRCFLFGVKSVLI